MEDENLETEVPKTTGYRQEMVAALVLAGMICTTIVAVVWIVAKALT